MKILDVFLKNNNKINAIIAHQANKELNHLDLNKKKKIHIAVIDTKLLILK